jgi:hypothetical protein
MFEFYRTKLDKNQATDLNITKQYWMALFLDPRTRLQPLVIMRPFIMDLCTYQPFLNNWMDRWFYGF